MSNFFGRSWDDWVREYSLSHRHPVNRWCHSLGIPLIVLSLPLMICGIAIGKLFPIGLVLFLAGWILQFIGHAFEGKPPEFFRDWRFLLVGVRWWYAKMRGRA